MDGLFTVSVGKGVDEQGFPESVGLQYKNGIANGVRLAAKNFALVRTPYSNEAPRLVELDAEGLQTGQCDYSTNPEDPSAARLLGSVPGPHEDALRCAVAIDADPWEAPADVHFQIGVRGELELGVYDNLNAYAMVASQM